VSFKSSKPGVENQPSSSQLKKKTSSLSLSLSPVNIVSSTYIIWNCMCLFD